MKSFNIEARRIATNTIVKASILYKTHPLTECRPSTVGKADELFDSITKKVFGIK
jgi:hypothetical protein